MENTRKLKNVSLRNSLNNGRQLLFISTHCATWQINESTLPLPNARSGSIKPTTLPWWTDGVRALSSNFVSCHSEEINFHNITIVFIFSHYKMSITTFNCLFARYQWYCQLFEFLQLSCLILLYPVLQMSL